MSPRRKQSHSATQHSQLLRELSPVPLLTTPPADPPTVRRNKKVAATLDFNWEVTEEVSVYQLTSETIRKKIATMYGVQISDIMMYIEHIHAWSPAVADSWVLVKDERYGVEGYDTGSLSKRGRAGIYYTKNSQFTIGPQSVEQVATIGCALGNATMRVKLTFWDARPGH